MITLVICNFEKTPRKNFFEVCTENFKRGGGFKMRYKCLENFEPLSTFPVHRESLAVFGENRTKKEGKQDDGTTRT